MNWTYIFCRPILFNSSAKPLLKRLFTNLEIFLTKHFFDASESNPSQPGKMGACSNLTKGTGLLSIGIVTSTISSILGVDVSSIGGKTVVTKSWSSGTILGSKISIVFLLFWVR